MESADGVNWGANSTTVATPYGLRDPSVTKIGSTWWVAYSCQGSLRVPGQFCLTSSTDLHTFSPPEAVPVATSLWAIAPEWVRNSDGSPYLDSGGCPHVATGISDLSSQFAVYELHPTNCSNFAAAWSAPVQLVVTGETTYFDPCLVFTGSGFTLWYSSINLNSSQHVQYAQSATMTGVYSRVSPGGDWIRGGINQEGSNFIQLADRWRVYFDRVPAPPGDISDGELNYSDSFDSGTTWTLPSPISSYGTQAKHGTVIPYP